MTPASSPIISITPNPALDLGGSVERLIPNEKNYVHDETRFPGGNAINAARIMHRLGVPVVVSGFLGRGVGSEIRDLIETEGLKHDFIPISGPARISITVSTQNTHQQTRLSFSGPTITSPEYQALLDYLNSIPAGSLVVLGGSLPPGLEASHLREMISALSSRGCECVVDVPGSALKNAFSSNEVGPLLIKPNLSEFQQFIGEEPTSTSDAIHAARKFTDRIPVICVSSVEGGAVLVTSKRAWFGRTPSVTVRTSVGAGDSMVGAMCNVFHRWGFKTRHDDDFLVRLEKNGDELLRWGLAAACATLVVQGTQLGMADHIRGFLPQIEIRQL